MILIPLGNGKGMAVAAFNGCFDLDRGSIFDGIQLVLRHCKRVAVSARGQRLARNPPRGRGVDFRLLDCDGMSMGLG